MYKKSKKKQVKKITFKEPVAEEIKVKVKKQPKMTKSKAKKQVKSSNASSWIQHVKSVQQKQKVSYKEALKLASQSYNKST